MEGNFFLAQDVFEVQNSSLQDFVDATLSRAKNREINQGRGSVLWINDKSSDGYSLRKLGRWAREWLSLHLTCP